MKTHNYFIRQCIVFAMIIVGTIAVKKIKLNTVRHMIKMSSLDAHKTIERLKDTTNIQRCKRYIDNKKVLLLNQLAQIEETLTLFTKTPKIINDAAMKAVPVKKETAPIDEVFTKTPNENDVAKEAVEEQGSTALKIQTPVQEVIKEMKSDDTQQSARTTAKGIWDCTQRDETETDQQTITVGDVWCELYSDDLGFNIYLNEDEKWQVTNLDMKSRAAQNGVSIEHTIVGIKTAGSTVTKTGYPIPKQNPQEFIWKLLGEREGWVTVFFKDE